MEMTSENPSYVRCRSCHHSVFIETRRCPHCGHMMRWNLKPFFIWLAAAILGALLSYGLVQLLDGIDTPAADQNAATPYNS